MSLDLDAGQNPPDTTADTRPTPKVALVSWALYDWANSSFSAVISTFVFPAYFTRQIAQDEISGTSLWGYTIGWAGLFIAMVGPVLGAVADQSGRRKPWIAVFTLLCIVPTGLMWYAKPGQDYIWLALMLAAVATIGVEIASIFYNAMLPDLAHHRNVGRWSGWGWGLGYAGGVASLVIALFGFIQGNVIIDLDRSHAEHVRATFVLVAVWFAVFSLPLFFITPDSDGGRKRLAQSARDGLRQLADSLRHVRRYRHIVRFFIARMIFIDGLATLFTFGGVYAAGTFNMTEQQVLMFGIALNITAGVGAMMFAWIDDWLGSKATIQISLIGLIAVGTAILLIDSQVSFWVLGLTLGIFVGPVQSASRSFLARAAPVELRTQMFGLLALSGKATAFLGPILVGSVTAAAGSQRVGMGVIIVFFIAGFLLMLTVPGTGDAEKPK
jgi:UMF1 family MFS transporter